MRVEQNILFAHVHTQHICLDRQAVQVCPFCKQEVAAFNFTDHLQDVHSFTLGAPLGIWQHNGVGGQKEHRATQSKWLAWIQSLMPAASSSAAPAAEPGCAKAFTFKSATARKIADAKAQAVQQTQRTDSPAVALASAQAAQGSCLSNLWLGQSGHPFRVQKVVCPFCVANPTLPEIQQLRMWNVAKGLNHITGIHIFNMQSSPSCCPTCDKQLPINRLALQLDCKHGIPLSGKVSIPLAEDLSNIGGQTQAAHQPAFLCWVQQGFSQDSSRNWSISRATHLLCSRSGTRRQRNPQASHLQTSPQGVGSSNTDPCNIEEASITQQTVRTRPWGLSMPNIGPPVGA